MSAPGADAQSILTESSRELAQQLRAESIGLTIGLWANGLATLAHGERDGEFATFHDLVGIPHVLFWLDSPERAHETTFRQNFNTESVRSPACVHWINNPATATEMAELYGFANVAPLAYGVDPDNFRPHDDVAVEYDVVFSLGAGAPGPTPVMLDELESETPSEQAIREDLFPRILERIKTRRLADAPAAHRDGLVQISSVLLEIQLANRAVPMLERLKAIAGEVPELVPAINALCSDSSLYADLAADIRSLEGWRRAFAVSWLARRHRCAVFGEPSLEGWDCNADYLGFIDYDAQSRAYASARIGLNVMRWQDDVGVNLKPFEISASGVPCVSEQRGGLDAVFTPDREIAVFERIDDLGQTVQSLLDDDTARRRMAADARERVHAEHLWKHRAEALATMITNARGG